MLWKRGWILDSLNYRTEKDLRETIYVNDSFKQNRWTLPERIITWSSKHIVLSVAMITSVFLLLSFCVSINYEILQKLLPNTISGMSDFIEFNEQIFTAQITILGLIFPLVIALIGILIQSKSSNKAIWHVYKHNSGFMLIGFSAITLITIFVGVKFLSPWLDYEQVVSINVSLASWFLMNLVLSGWFLFKTVNFLTNSSRMKIVVEYAINEVLINDIRLRLRHHLFNNAAKLGFIGSGYKNLDISTLSIKSLPHKITVFRNTPHKIKNIFFRPLKWGLRSFASKYERHLCQLNKLAKVTFPIDANSQQDGAITLAETDLGRFDDFSSVLIRTSFRFSKVSEKEVLNLEQIVSAMFGQLEDSLKESNTILFSSAIDDLESFQREIESCMFFINDNDEPDNWMLLLDSSFWGRDYLHVFIQQTIRISDVVTNRIVEDQSYFYSWCYFFPHIYSKRHSERPVEIGVRYVNGHYLLWEKLMANIGDLSLSDELSRVEDSALKRFISSWEHWHYLIDIKSAVLKHEKLAFEHLANTSKMVISALKFNNWNSCRWAVDVLSNWNENFSSDYSNETFRWHTDAITSKLLKENSDSPLFKHVFGDSEPKLDDIQAIVLKNYWIDVRCLTAAYILSSKSSRGLSQDKVNELVNMIVMVKGVAESGGVRRLEGDINNPSELLSVFLRQQLPWVIGFDSWHEKHLERLSSIEEPDWVSGRVYSSFGSKISVFVPVFFKVLGISLSQKNFNLTYQWTNFLKSGALNQQELEDIVRKLRGLTEADEQVLERVCLFSSIGREEALKKSLIFDASISNIIEDLESLAHQNIQNAEVDLERLTWMGRVCSESAFDVDNSPIPQMLFSKLNFVEITSSEPFIINVNEYDKSNVAKNIEVNRAVNEESWLQDLVEDRLKVQIIRQMYNAFEFLERGSDDELSLMKRVIEDSEQIKAGDGSPILFVGERRITTLIDYSRFGYIPDEDRLKYDIKIESDQPSTYVAHVGGVEVHKLPVLGTEICLLVEKESFASLNVKQYEEGRYVNCEFIQSESDALKGTLRIEFETECEFENPVGYKYTLSDRLEDE